MTGRSTIKKIYSSSRTAALLLLAASTAQAGDRRDIEPNGPQLNGIELVPPVGTGKLSLLAVELRPGVILADGRKLSGATVQGSALHLPAVTGNAWIGAQLHGVASDHAPLRLRIDRIETAPDPDPKTAENENADVTLYALSYQWGAGSGEKPGAWQPKSEWAPLCADGALAVAVAGRWDYHTGQPGDSGRRSSDPAVVTFACRTSSIAKCVELLGYKPWRKPQPAHGRAVSLDALHQACVRALRADYCGNGDSLTQPGVQVNVYDVIKLRRDVASWTSEAAWTPAGAACVHSTRLERNPADATQSLPGYIAKHCLKSWSERSCEPAASALLFTEHMPRPANP